MGLQNISVDGEQNTALPCELRNADFFQPIFILNTKVVNLKLLLCTIVCAAKYVKKSIFSDHLVATVKSRIVLGLEY